MYKRLIRAEDKPYHLYARANNKEWFSIPTSEVWGIFCGLLEYLCREYSLRIHGFVLMSNHFHLLVSTPEANLDTIMQVLMREASRKINERAGKIDHVFGGPYKWCLIRSWFQYMQTYRYIYQNPVRAGICEKVEEYPYSSLWWLTRNHMPFFPIIPAEFESKSAELRLPYINQLPWLNRILGSDEYDCMRRALKHREFELRAVRNKRFLPSSLIENYYTFQTRQLLQQK